MPAMPDWKRFLSAVGEVRFIVGLGVLEVLMAIGRIVLWEGETDLSGMVATDLLIVVPGLILVYGGYRLSASDL